MPDNRNITAFVEFIQALLVKNDIKGALEEMQKFLKNTPLFSEVILQSGHYTATLKDMRLGVVTHEQSEVELNRIRRDLLAILEEIEGRKNGSDHVKAEMNQAASSAIQHLRKQELEVKIKSRKRLTLLATASFLCFVVFLFLWNANAQKERGLKEDGKKAVEEKLKREKERVRSEKLTPYTSSNGELYFEYPALFKGVTAEKFKDISFDNPFSIKQFDLVIQDDLMLGKGLTFLNWISINFTRQSNKELLSQEWEMVKQAVSLSGSKGEVVSREIDLNSRRSFWIVTNLNFGSTPSLIDQSFIFNYLEEKEGIVMKVSGFINGYYWELYEPAIRQFISSIQWDAQSMGKQLFTGGDIVNKQIYSEISSAVEEKDYPTVIQKANELLEKDSMNLFALWQKGMALQSQEKVNEALNIYKEMKRKNKDFYYADFLAGKLIQGVNIKKNPQKNQYANYYFARAHKKEPASYSTLFELGKIYITNDKFEEALYCFHKVDSLTGYELKKWKENPNKGPGNLLHWNDISYRSLILFSSLCHYRLKNYEEALSIIQLDEYYSTQGIFAKELEAKSLYELGDTRKACKILRRVLRKNKNMEPESKEKFLGLIEKWAC